MKEVTGKNFHLTTLSKRRIGPWKISQTRKEFSLCLRMENSLRPSLKLSSKLLNCANSRSHDVFDYLDEDLNPILVEEITYSVAQFEVNGSESDAMTVLILHLKNTV